ncbi:MAG: DUF262 domain-containing protein [Prevotella sp.]|nr:DUF262 domain-containing protein [Prevotella sp.]
MYQTLYNILCRERIEIPIIQRDYAQGRENKIYLRERLLGGMIQALRDGKVLSMDFVYGTNEYGAMWPLDGQQRLTTLWLLHWYLAVRTNNLSSANTWLGRFTYETRITSRDFCKSLCSMDAETFNQSGMKLVDFIKDQTWFYSKYKQDPTIQGMLRTLGGTKITNSENEDICDGIEEFLASDNNCQAYWERLLAEDCPIRFLFKDMKDENLPLSDDLYIKMNARGKQLTDFENFKADLIGYAPDQDHPYDKLLDVKTASLIDNDWTDIFWKDASAKSIFKVDDIYYKFLRRYFLDRLIATSPCNVQEIQKVTLYQDLYKGKENYDGLKGYNEVLTPDTIEALKKLFARWNSVKIAPYWDETVAFAFIPEYIIKVKDSKGMPMVVEVTTISQKERAIFHAVCCYFEYNESFSKERFEQWMHFVWNIVENSNVNDEDAMIGAIRLFEELRPQSGNILSFLASSEKIHSNFSAKQMEEERFKAKLLCGEHQSVWQPLLDEAEKNLFFKGNIACLLRCNGKEFVDDIECFKVKLTHAKMYFDDKGIRNEYALPLTKALIKIAHRWDQIIDQYIYDTSADAWKWNILHNTDNEYYAEVHTLLTTDNLETLEFVRLEDDEWESVNSANDIKSLLAKTKFLEMPTFYGNIVNNGSEWRIRCIDDEILAFYPCRKTNAYCFDWRKDCNHAFRRNNLLHHPNITVDEKNLDVEGIYWKWDVFFNYKGNSFKWSYDNKIYLLNRQNNPKRRNSRHINDRNDEYFCINMNELPEVTHQGLLVRLSRIAKEADV